MSARTTLRLQTWQKAEAAAKELRAYGFEATTVDQHVETNAPRHVVRDLFFRVRNLTAEVQP